MTGENSLISEPESAIVGGDDCAFSESQDNTIVKTVGKTTYIARIFFKNEGRTFSEKLKKVFEVED